MNLPRVDVAVKAVRVSGLVVTRRPPGPALGDGSGHGLEVAVEPVHGPVFYAKPASAVNPRSPFSKVGNEARQVAIVQLASQISE
jgi:hypothetical protein